MDGIRQVSKSREFGYRIWVVLVVSGIDYIFEKGDVSNTARSSLNQAETHTLTLHCPVPTIRPFSKSLPVEGCFQCRIQNGSVRVFTKWEGDVSSANLG